MPAPRRVVVVGGGVTGLAAAHRLLRPGADRPVPEVILLEASDRVGGKVLGVEVGGVAVEGGPDSILARKPWGMQLIAELGLSGELMAPGATGAHVWSRGRLVPLPRGAGFGVPTAARDLLGFPGLSPAGRLRALAEVWVPRRRGAGDRAVGAFAARRFGRECARVLVDPLLAGIQAADPDRLSLLATAPGLAAWERDRGSLLRAAREAARRPVPEGAAPGPAFVEVRGGLARLTGALAEAVGPARIRTRAPASALRRAPGGGGWAIEAEGRTLAADAVVLAVPAHEAARLVAEAAPAAASALSGIPYASTATVAMIFPEGTGAALPDATGFLVPPGSRVGGRPAVVTACTWLSRKWPSPAFGDRAVLRAFVGRAGDEGALEMDDGALAAAALGDVQAMHPVGAEPDAVAVVRWPRGMPQYEVGHLDRVARIDRALAAEAPGLFVAGSAYRGVGIPDCIRQGWEAAEAVRGLLAAAAAPAGAGGDQEAISWTK